MKEAATLTIRRAQKMTKRGRRSIAGWLRRQATALIAEGEKYAPTFTARYTWVTEEDA